MSIQLLVKREIRGKNGELVKDSGFQESKSFVLAFLRYLFTIMNTQYGVIGPILAIVDTGNAARNIESAGISTPNMLAIQNPAETSTYGIVVGSNAGAESNSDHDLLTQIINGGGGGQLHYGGVGIVQTVVVGANVDLFITQTFSNGGGVAVDVNEVGIYFSSVDSGATQRYFCMVRDVLGATDVIPNGGIYTVTYIIRTTV